ncbi:MAG: ABC transporter substrate-binding protein [Pseudomonadota bacterium]
METELQLKRILADKRATRRDFLVGATALGLSITAATAMWNEAKAAEPKRGGHLKAGLNDSNTIDSLDPATFNATTMICISRAFRDSLVEVGQDNSAVPTLAESWESSPDALVWRFKLRNGVEFSNGKSLTTDDVIDSINVHRGPDTKSGAAGVFSGIEDVTADGDVVQVTLKEANADFPFLMTDYHMNIMPSKDGKAEVLSDVGTGTYLLKEFEPGVYAALERNPNAWQSDFGFVDSCEITTILDDAARESALLTQDVQVINRPGLKTISRLAKVPHVNIVDVPSNLAFTHPMRQDIAPFDNADFRKALKHALPRQEFVDKILFGYGVIGNDQPLGPVFNNYDPAITSDYDLDKAKAFMKSSGLGDNVKIEMHTSDTAYGGAVDAAQLFREHFLKIGVDMTVTREPKDGYWSDVWNVKPFCSCYWGARPVEDMILSIAYLSDAPWNDSVINIPRVDELVKAARGELDPAVRKGMYSEVQQLISEDGGTLIPAFGKDVAATTKDVGIGPNLGGGWEMDGGHFIKRWWLA